jgi:hypothetical protein
MKKICLDRTASMILESSANRSFRIKLCLFLSPALLRLGSGSIEPTGFTERYCYSLFVYSFGIHHGIFSHLSLLPIAHCLLLFPKGHQAARQIKLKA